MPRSSSLFVLALALICPLGISSAFGQSKIAVGPQISTLGVGVSANLRLMPVLSFSGEYNFAPLNTYKRRGFGTVVSVEPSLQGGAVMVHLHPGGGRFAIGGGVLIGGVDADGTYTFDDDIDLASNRYSGSDVGDLQLEFNYGKVAPVAIFGWVGRGFTFLFGAALAAPSLEASATGPISGDAQFQQDLDTELNDFTDALNQVPVFPYLRLGWQFGGR